jgi:hypothetical protein
VNQGLLVIPAGDHNKDALGYSQSLLTVLPKGTSNLLAFNNATTPSPDLDRVTLHRPPKAGS